MNLRVSKYLTRVNLYVVLIFFALVAMFQLLLTSFNVPSYILPTPFEIGQILVSPPVDIVGNLGVTLYEILIGFVIALLLAVGLATIISLSDFVRRVLYPYVLTLHLVPKVAVAPLLVIWFGFGLEPKIVMVFLIAFFPMFVDTVTGFASVQPDVLNVVNALGFTRAQVLRKVRFPSALPFMFSGMKTGITLAVVGAVIVELISSNVGVGYILLEGMVASNTPLVFAMLILISLVGIAMFGVIGVVESVMLPWYILPRKEQAREEV